MTKRFCFNCTEKVEDEMYVLTEYPLYDDLRHVLYQKAGAISDNYNNLSEGEKNVFYTLKL